MVRTTLMCSSIFAAFLLASMVNSGSALHCFRCDSESDQRCEHSPTNMTAEDCNSQHPITKYDHYRHWLLKASDLTHMLQRPTNKTDDTVCQTLVGRDDRNVRTVVRRCQRKIDGIVDSCHFTNLEMKILGRKNYKIESCEVCAEDACNMTSRISTQLIYIISCATIAFSSSKMVIL